MFLATHKVRSRGYTSGFTQKQLRPQLAPAELDILVTNLRNGDPSNNHMIIESHMGLALHIVGRYVNYVPMKSDDLVGVAMVAVAEAVEDFMVKARDNNITAFITSRINGLVYNFIREDTTIHVTRYQQEQLAKEYNETGEINLPQMSAVDQLLNSTNPLDRQNKLRLLQKCATFEDNSRLELNEIVELLNFTRFEALVFEHLMNGFNDEEIGKVVGRGRARICQIKHEIRAKLLVYYPEFAGR